MAKWSYDSSAILTVTKSGCIFNGCVGIQILVPSLWETKEVWKAVFTYTLHMYQLSLQGFLFGLHKPK